MQEESGRQYFAVTLLGVKFSFPCIEEKGVLYENALKASFIRHAQMTGLFRAFLQELRTCLPDEHAAREDIFWNVVTDGHEFRPTWSFIRYLEQNIGIAQIKFWRNNGIIVITSRVAIRRFLPFGMLDSLTKQIQSVQRRSVYYGPNLARFSRTMRT